MVKKDGKKDELIEGFKDIGNVEPLKKDFSFFEEQKKFEKLAIELINKSVEFLLQAKKMLQKY